jgi:hypothetical protein
LPHWILNPARLPIPPLSHEELFKAGDYTINLRILTISDSIIRNVKKIKKAADKGGFLYF